jgi:hypothetical protein
VVPFDLQEVDLPQLALPERLQAGGGAMHYEVIEDAWFVLVQAHHHGRIGIGPLRQLGIGVGDETG